jgi:hypothetical protein
MFKPLGDRSIGPLIVAAVIVGFVTALALLFYIATMK